MMRWSEAFSTASTSKLDGLELRPKAGLVVYYDETCDSCVRTARRLDAVNWLGQVRFRQAREHPTLKGKQYEDIQAISRGGKCYSGFPTYRQVAWRIPLLWLVLPLLYLPLFAGLARRLYKRTSNNRDCVATKDRSKLQLT